LIQYSHPLIWIPLALVQGFTVFNFTVMLHEVVHHTVFRRPHPAAERALALLYATPSGISASQFTRWHLDHHAELGSKEDDPKRAHLSPKINARWLKLLYATPALFNLLRAARRSRQHAQDLQRTMAASAGCRWDSISRQSRCSGFSLARAPPSARASSLCSSCSRSRSP
jgi:fatty acid desaturase